MVDWPSYNRSLVRRGEIIFSYDFLDSWDYELEEMNKSKKGKPFVFPNCFILIISYIRISFHLPYRQTEGIIKATGKRLLPANPSYGHICKRINRLNIDIKKDNPHDDTNDLVIAIDSTGIKLTNRSQWMDKKWNKQNKKGYLKIHVAVNIQTKEIMALEVTDEKVHDGKILKKLVNHAMNNSTQPNSAKIKSILADGAYDSNNNFRYLEEKKIVPGIKVRKNSVVSIRNNRLRNKEIRLQKKDLLKWKKKRKYGQRWMAESVFSSFKRMFGEYILATKLQNMVKEMMIKVSLYNLFRRI